MPHWRRICCPVDFSAVARAALEEGARLATELDAQLVLVHVFHDNSPSEESILAPPPPSGRAREGDEQQFTAWIEDAQRLAPGRINSVELSGDPAEKIVGFAKEFACDIIVMGAHGRTGLKHLARGSVTNRVIRSSSSPVLVVPEDMHP
jgi:nucleotide-binding universal stress UspA family protein